MKKITLILFVLVAFCWQSNAQVQIGDGTYNSAFNTYPFNPYYGFSYAQSIYLASEINATGDITSISFEMSDADAIGNSDDEIDVWIGHTTKTQFDTTTDWVDVSTLSQVMTNGTLTKSGTTITFTFSAPFTYNGTDNIIIALDANEADYDTSADKLIGTDSGASRTLRQQSDSVNADPTAPPTGVLTPYIGNITLNGITQTCPNPSALTATNIAATQAELGWTAGGSETLWDIEIVDVTGVGTVTGTATATGVSNPHTYMGLASNNDYEFYVRADCTGGDFSGWVGPFSFTTIASTPPDCPVVTATPDAACGNYDSNLSWAAVANADSYAVSVGTVSGGIDIADNVDVGTALTYDFSGMPNTTYFYTVTATNTAGVSTSCTEDSLMTQMDGCYCDPSSTNTNTTTFIDNVSTTGGLMDLSNLGSGLSANHYVDNFATMGVTSYADGSFDFTVEIQGGTLGLAIWIDWNNDKDYEVSENVFTTTSYGNGPFTGTITVPNGTANGDYHMRIMGDWNDSNPGNDDACSLAFGRGETEDYKVTIADAPACTPPTATTNTVLTDTTADFTWAGTEAAWEYANLPSPSTEPASGTSTMTASASITGLTAETDYDFYVRSDCGGTYSNWIMVSYTTLSTPPANNNCSGAISLTPGADFDANPAVGTNLGATGSGELPLPGCATYDPDDSSGFGGDVWYSVTVPSDGNLTIQTNANPTGNGGDSGMAVYSGSCGSLDLVECDDDDSPDGAYSQVVIEPVDALADQVVYVRVWEYSGNAALDFQVSAYSASLSVDDFNNQIAFTYFPNPVKNTLTLNAQNTIENVTMYNMLGQEVLRAIPNAVESDIDMSNLQNGTYFVQVTVANIIKTIRVIKQ